MTKGQEVLNGYAGPGALESLTEGNQTQGWRQVRELKRRREKGRENVSSYVPVEDVSSLR